jgi:competence protein ComGC
MTRAGYCDQCGENVWLAPDGSCMRGHGAEHVTGAYEAGSPPSPQPVPTPGAYAPAPAPRKNNTGVVIAIVAVVLIFMLFVCGIIAAIAIPIFSAARTGAQQKVCYANQRLIISAAESYEADKGKPPSSMQDLVGAGLMKSVPVCPNDGRYEWDPKTHRISCSVHGSFQSDDSTGPNSDLGTYPSDDSSATP